MSDEAKQTQPTEVEELIDALATQRGFLRQTVQGISDEQARERTTVSELTLGGLIKHVAFIEADWADFMVNGAKPPVDWEAIDWSNPPEQATAFMASHVMGDEETLAGLLEEYERVQQATEDLLRTLPLDQSHRLPETPWFPPDANWSVRRVAAHVLAETAQHSGHADILREALDGQKTMG